MKIRHVISCALAVLLVSCASGGGSGDSTSASSGATSTASLSQRLNERNGYEQDAQGNWLPQSDKRSSFERNRNSPYFQGSHGKKQYQAEEFAKKPWWGSREVTRQTYAGNTDGGRFGKSSELGARTARETGAERQREKNFRTGNYGTGAAGEAGAVRLDKPADARTDLNRRAYPDASIIGWREQRGLSVNQTKGMLGRE